MNSRDSITAADELDALIRHGLRAGSSPPPADARSRLLARAAEQHRQRWASAGAAETPFASPGPAVAWNHAGDLGLLRCFGFIGVPYSYLR